MNNNENHSNRELDGFQKRTEQNQFRRDGQTISELYDFTIEYVCSKGENPDCVLRIFNNAYMFCWYCVKCNKPIREIYSILSTVESSDFYRNTALAVAYVVLSITGDISQTSVSTLKILRQKLSLEGSGVFVDFARRYNGTISHPINYQKPGIVIIGRINLDEIKPKVEIKKSQIAEFEESFRNILDKIKAQENENERLRKELYNEKILHQKDIDSRDEKLQELRSSLSIITKQVDEQRQVMASLANERNILVHETSRYQVEVARKNAIDKVINIDSIVEYVNGCSAADEIDAIARMLNKISRRKCCFDEKLNDAIVEIEDRVNDLRRPDQRSITNNFGQGSAYNDIHDNPNSTISNNGRR